MGIIFSQHHRRTWRISYPVGPNGKSIKKNYMERIANELGSIFIIYTHENDGLVHKVLPAEGKGLH